MPNQACADFQDIMENHCNQDLLIDHVNYEDLLKI